VENILQNLFAPEVRVCGKWLKRYTLWHHLLLKAFQSPFLSEDPDERITPADVLVAVSICKTGWPHRPRFRATPRSLLWEGFLLFPSTFRKSAEALHSWVSFHSEGPSFWRDTSKTGGGLTAPEIYSLVYGLTSKAGLSELDAWSKSPGQAEAILATVAEMEGAEIHFCDPQELEEAAPIQPADRAEIEALARRDLGEQRAAAFMENWDRNHAN